MSEEPVEPLDRELRTLLESERRAAAPSAALARVWSRVSGVPLSGSGRSEGASAARGWLASHAAGVAAVAFVAGGGAGAAIHAAIEPARAVKVVYVDRPSPASAAIDHEKAVPEAPTAPASAVALLPSTSLQPAPSSSSLSAERTLIDEARTELGSGNASHALSLLDVHAHRFAMGQLAEEREALVVQSLVALGRYDEARATAARFRAATPESLFLPAIEASLASIP